MIETLNNTANVLEVTDGECKLLSVKVINPFEKVLQYEKIESANADEELHTEIAAEYEFFMSAAFATKNH